jgi:hypothetical protein
MCFRNFTAAAGNPRAESAFACVAEAMCGTAIGGFDLATSCNRFRCARSDWTNSKQAKMDAQINNTSPIQRHRRRIGF